MEVPYAAAAVETSLNTMVTQLEREVWVGKTVADQVLALEKREVEHTKEMADLKAAIALISSNQGTRRRPSVKPVGSILSAITSTNAAVSAVTKRAHGIHMMTMVRATENGVSKGRAVALVCLSLLVIVIQLTILRIISTESSHPRCNDHSGCKLGEFCAPSADFIFGATLDPGFCNDCYSTDWVLHSNRSQAEQIAFVSNGEHANWKFVFAAGNATYWNEAAAYCAATDTMPLRCDHLVLNRNTLSGGGALVLIIIAFLVIIPTINDLDQTDDELAVMAARGVFEKSGLVKGLLFMSHRARVYLVPGFVVTASAGLILSNTFTSQSFLLNGMAITFASSIDDLLAFFFVSQGERERIENLVEKEVAEHEEGGWLSNRCYGGLLAVSLSVIVINCEQLMGSFSLNELKDYEGDPCSVVVDVILSVPLCVVFAVFLMKAASNPRNKTRPSVVKDILLTTLSLLLVFIVSVSLTAGGLHIGTAV
jgi:hypothetical protein